jgi:hypothetical protein
VQERGHEPPFRRHVSRFSLANSQFARCATKAST